MKKVLVAVLVAGMTLSMGAAVMAKTWINAGATNEGYPVVEIGTKTVQDGIGVGIEYSNVNIYDLSNVNNYPCPHNDTTTVLNNETTLTQGVDLIIFTGAVYAGAGIYVNHNTTVSRSNATGWNYTEGETMDVQGALCAGVQLELGILNIKAQYHTIKGAIVTAGIIF